MSISRDKLEQAAQRLIERHCEDFEFLTIVEHDVYGEWDEDDQYALLDVINDAGVEAIWTAP